MNTSFFIARRYLFSKKSVNAINFISGISMLGVFVGSAALVIILSVFNGFEKLVLSMFNTMTPELLIQPAEGKTFDPAPVRAHLQSYGKSLHYTEVLQEKALLKYDESQHIALVKGVGSSYGSSRRFDTVMVEGDFLLEHNAENFAVIGSAVQAYLSINTHDDFRDLEIYSPRKGVTNSAIAAEEFIMRNIHPVGVFEVQQQFDEMVIVPLRFARELLGEEKEVSAIEVNTPKSVSAAKVRNELEEKLGSAYLIRDRQEQNELLYKILNTEKWAIFLILTFVLIIAIFNIIGSLTMLVIDKKQDIAVLSSLGASNKLIRNIFFTEGMMIAGIGCISGMAVGLLFCLLQQRFELIKMGSANMIIEAYPVAIKSFDFVLVFLTVSGISVIASLISSRLSVKNLETLKQDL